MNRKLIVFSIIIGMVFSGYIGYSINGITIKNIKNEVMTNVPKSNKIQSSSPNQKTNDLVVNKNIVYVIDGVQRKDTESIIYKGKVFAPVEYIAQSLGMPFQNQQSENLIRLGLSMGERVVQEKFLVSDNASFLKFGMTSDQVENVIGSPQSSNKRFNECTSNNEMISLYKDLEILYMYDVNDKKYFISDITVFTENIQTEKGISISSTAEDIIKVYGELVEYSGNEHVKVTEGFSGDGLVRYGIKESLWFELKGGRVVRFGIKLPHC